MRKGQSIIGCVLGATIGLAAFAAAAQEGQPIRLRGEITAVKGQTLDILTREGENRQIELASNAKVMVMQPSSLDAIKQDSYVGVAARPEKEGSEIQTAVQVVIFPESLKGAGEGYPSWGTEPGVKLTSGTVQSRESGDKGPVLGLRYPQGGAKVVVPANTPIVALAPGDRDQLKPGNQVLVPAAQKKADGKLTAELPM